MYKHYILTRYNAGIYDRADAWDWMTDRRRLFVDTKKSIENQTINNQLTWVLQFDERTPSDIVKDLCRSDNVKIKPVMTNHNGHAIIAEYWRYFLKEEIKTFDKKARHIITTRFDNDDLLHPEFCADLYRFYKNSYKGGHHIVDFKGVKIWADGVKELSTRKRANSPFLSMISPVDNLRHCYERSHSNMPNDYRWNLLNSRRYTIRVHGNNAFYK